MKNKRIKHTSKNHEVVTEPDKKTQQLIISMFNSNELDNAERQCLLMLAQHPNSLFLNKILAAIYLRQGKNESVVLILNKNSILRHNDAQVHSFLGSALKNTGNYDAAIASYEKAIQINPNCAEFYNNLAGAYQAKNNLNQAFNCYDKAIDLNPFYVEAICNKANILKQIGQIEEAARLCDHAISINSSFFGSYFTLGLISFEKQNYPESLDYFIKAINLNPMLNEAYINIGNILSKQRRFKESIDVYLKAYELNPQNAETLFNIGNCYKELNRYDDSILFYNKSLQIDPNSPDTWNNLGIAHSCKSMYLEAVQCFTQAIRIKHDHLFALNNLGDAYYSLGKMDESIQCYKMATSIDPNYAGAYNNIGNVFKELSQYDAALFYYEKAVSLKNDFFEAYNNIGAVYFLQGIYSKSEEFYKKALIYNDKFAEAHNNLGILSKEFVKIDDAISFYNKAIENKPEYEDAYGNLLFAINYHPNFSKEKIFSYYRNYELQFSLERQIKQKHYLNKINNKRKIKIGYVSPDFRRHSMQSFIEPVLSRHNNDEFEIYLYAEISSMDELSLRYQNMSDHWMITRGISDRQLAEKIREDGIDILVDLAGHTAGNRLRVFSCKPAPTQVSWLGYACTTGLQSIDYYLCDSILLPEGEESIIAEKPWRLPGPSLVYRQPDDWPDPGELPALQNGYITFGCLSRSVRLNDHVLDAWTTLLTEISDAKLIINSGSFKSIEMIDWILQRFADRNIPENRLEIGFDTPPWKPLRKIDISLDCFPHNSGTTLVESLYMGVPFITLAHRPTVGRVGSLILHAANCSEWIAMDIDDYITKAKTLAYDYNYLKQLRTLLRNKICSSPLMDEEKFTRMLEEAYQSMYKNCIN